jgi:hypothetical protein
MEGAIDRSKRVHIANPTCPKCRQSTSVRRVLDGDKQHTGNYAHVCNACSVIVKTSGEGK